MSGWNGFRSVAQDEMLWPYQVRAIRIGVYASFLVLAAMALYPMLPGPEMVQAVPYAVVLAAAGSGAALVAALPWTWLFERGWGQRCLYAWSVLDIGLVSAAVAVTGFERSEMYLLYVPIVVFYAASYPLRSQLALSALTVVAYLAVLAAGPSIDGSALVIRIIATASVFFLASFLARELADQMRQHGRSRDDAERRANLLAVVASAARELDSRTVDEVLEAVADAVLALGFDAGGIAVEMPCGTAYRAVHARGEFPRGESWWPLPLRSGAAPQGVSVRGGDPDAAHAPPVAPRPAPTSALLQRRLAVPIGASTSRQAVLLAGSRLHGRLGDVDREALDLLASRAARALESADHAAALARSERRFRSLVQNASDLITVIDADGVITYQSVSSQDVLGRAPSALLGRALDALVHPDDVPALHAALRAAGDGGQPGPVEVRVRDAAAQWRRIDTRVTDLRDEPAVGGFVLNGRDVTERQRLVDELGYQAGHDALTGLPNRVQIHDRADRALAAAGQDGLAALLFIDLDDFKSLNDLFGHPIGDSLLVEISRRFSDALPEAAALGRFGGDEFVVVLDTVTSEQAALAAAERLGASLEAPITAGEAELHVNATIGIAVGRGGAEDADELLRRADIAMYAAKATGKGRAAVFDASMEVNLRARHALERDLRESVERGDFELHFQPIVSLATGELTGVESLVRWRHPTRGLVAPADFIPLAEETALIVPLGRFVLRESCRQLADWRRRHAHLDDLRVSVNVSTLQLLDAGFADDVATYLVEHDVPPSAIVLEITEATLADQPDTVIDSLVRLKRLGVGVAIDDFGTGYSSLGYLGTFPVDALKIDRSFVSRLGAGDDAETLVAAVVDLARRLSLSVIAEGIEHPAQLDFLRGLGCSHGQGFLFARPSPASELEALLAARLEGTVMPGADGMLETGDSERTLAA